MKVIFIKDDTDKTKMNEIVLLVDSFDDLLDSYSDNRMKVNIICVLND